MKFREIAGGLSIATSNEEELLIEKIGDETSFLGENLNEREQELARKMVSRGLLLQIEEKNKVRYLINDLEDIWRE